MVDNTTGSGTGTGNVLVDKSAVLRGSGIIAPNANSGVTIASGGQLYAGDTATGTTANGFLKLTSASGATTPILTLATPAHEGSAQLQFDLGDGGANGVTFAGAVVGGVTLAGSSTYIDLGNDPANVVFSSDPNDPTLISLNALTSLSDGNYLLFAGGPNTDYANWTNVSLLEPEGYFASHLFMQDGNIYVDISAAAVPEPGTWALLLMGLLGLSAWRRARRLNRAP